MELKGDGIEVARGGRLTLQAPDFTVAAGETALLRGPNGSGKSTLLRALAGFLPLARGEATLDGLRLSKDRDGFAERIAYAGHLDAVKPALTVRANLAGWADIFGAPLGRADAALERFALSHVADMPAAYCSAGQKRRLGLARLLVVDRPVWLLDEPTVSLDASAVKLFADAVAEHCGGGGIAIAATHIDLGLAAGPVIQLTPPTERAAEADDPFLSESWA